MCIYIYIYQVYVYIDEFMGSFSVKQHGEFNLRVGRFSANANAVSFSMFLCSQQQETWRFHTTNDFIHVPRGLLAMLDASSSNLSRWRITSINYQNN